jgi:excisionase family DNA binding protein
MTADVHELNLLTVREAAALLRQSERSVRRKVRSGEIPAVRLGGPGAPLRVPAHELEAWLYEEPVRVVESACDRADASPVEARSASLQGERHSRPARARGVEGAA